MTFICDAEQTEGFLYPDSTKCRVSCPKNMRPTDPEIVCSCYRAAGTFRNGCRWMPRRRYTPMKCVQAEQEQTKDTFDLQHQMMFNMLPGGNSEAPSLSAQESPVREMEFEFVVFNPQSELQFNPVGMAPFEMAPIFNVSSELETIKIDDEHIGDDIVFSRFQAKSLRKAGYDIPSYRVLPTNLEVAARFGITRSRGTSAAISTSAATERRVGDRAAIVAVNSKMVKSRWTKYKKKDSFIVPFYFSSSFPGSREIRKEILSHVDWFNKETNFCIKIEEVDQFDKQFDERIRIIDGNGCWSYIGMTGDNPQDISLGTLCHTRGLALHEFLHALGFDHEQNRPDRDEHIEVHWDNIAQSKKWNFQILGESDWENTGSPYDFLSVMHYSSANFAAGSKPTMSRRDTGEAVRAQRNRPSTLDISQVCHIYGCAKHCGHEIRQCKNGQEVFKHRFCDGIIDCADESDEEGCDWGCCSNFEITLNGRTHAYSRAGQYKGKDYFYSESDDKYLFSFFNYWGFAKTLGQPSFYYHAKWDGQCPDDALFWYYSWVKGAKDTTSLKCTDNLAQSITNKPTGVASFFADSIFKETSTTTTTTTTTMKTTTTTTTTTTTEVCRVSDLPRVPEGKWLCSSTSCTATCNSPSNFELVCNIENAERRICSGGQWSSPAKNASCLCKKKIVTCGKLVALSQIWLNRNAKYQCTDGDKEGSACSVSCPSNMAAICSSTKKSPKFECNDGKWSNNIENDCVCKPACPNILDQIKQYKNKDIVPDFSKCTSRMKSAKCNGRCANANYQRKRQAFSSKIETKCFCKGNDCLWGIKKEPIVDAFCIRRFHCEHPKYYFSSKSFPEVTCNSPLKNELFFEVGTQCQLSNCDRTPASFAGGMMCDCSASGECAWAPTTGTRRRSARAVQKRKPSKVRQVRNLKSIKRTIKVKC